MSLPACEIGDKFALRGLRFERLAGGKRLKVYVETVVKYCLEILALQLLSRYLVRMTLHIRRQAA